MESIIVINGQLLSDYEAMVVRVAVTSFMMSIQTDGLGSDPTGVSIAKNYSDHCNAILEKILHGNSPT